MASSRFAAVTTAAVTVLMGATACVTPTAGPEVPPLTGSIWELQQIQMSDGTLLTADPAQNYTAEFADNGQVFVRADCNRAIGEFEAAADGQISVNLGPTTLAACPEGSIGSQFLQAMNNASFYFFQDEDLFIDLTFDSGTMQFSSTSAPALIGTLWKLQQIQMGDDTLLVPDQPEHYTAEFLEDGTLLVRADCNRGRSQFSTNDDRSLEVSPIATTLAACPEGSIGNEFVQALSNSATYFFQDGNLFIDLAFDSGTMQFSAD
ncbi:META domain-containing protein [Nodosilinea sp. LEGE 06152]|uniref:META domain-containing protein n=1 Tax=Nodosilinea sp. LEGE 06152 TaxID=2777966 RepID=UPI00187FC624|nr:META domain-containing protein [Nodosilinea sp. LEGE 06152]MBE9158725.1 META domain-containing protein [Nodosilinea sp. LEGE 06152]